MKEKSENKIESLLPWKHPFLIGLFLFALGIFSSNAQTVMVNGVVYDKTNEPLIGVSVTVKSTTKGTVTDLDGKFNLEAKNSDVIVFKYLGFKDKEVKVTGASMGKITMDDSAYNLDEFVVVGYGTQKKGDITGSIATVNDKTIEQKQPISVFDALKGEVPGMQITSVSGAPGAGNTVVVRGGSTLEGGGNPLYVVDGIIMEDIDAINPNDIQSTSILKDAASASIYGARAGNGVILITTKTGSIGKPKVSVRYINSYGRISNKIPQLNREEREIYDNTVVSASKKNPFQFFKQNTDSVNLQARTSNDYQDLISRTSVRHDANISIQSGTDKMNVFTSLGLLDEKGIILTSYFKRYTGRSKVTYNASDNLKFTTNISGVYQNGNNISEGNTFYNAIRRPTQSLVWFPDGSLVGAYESNPSGKRNPLIELYYRTDESSRYSGSLYQNFELKFAKYFTLTGAATANLYYQERKRYTGAETKTSQKDYDAGLDSGSDETRFYTNIALESYLRYARSFNKAHNVEVMFGASMEDENLKTRYTSMETFLIKGNEDMWVPQATLLPSSTSIDGSGTSIGSYFGRLSYDYLSRYIFRTNFRRDGSSRFGEKNRWGFFPSASAAWRFSDEIFMDWSKPILSDAKIRASWGVAGNDRVGVSDALSLFEISATKSSYGGVPGVYPSSRLGNPYLQWEETKQTNIGLDLTFLDGQIVFVADYYVKKTDKLFSDDEIPSELGYANRRMNIGSIENKGLELSVTAIPISNKDITWSTTINWSKNKNEIVSLAADKYAYKDNWWVESGAATGNFYGYKNMGVYQYDASNAYTEDYKTRLNPVFERDRFGNVVITKSGGPQVIGYTYPDGRDYGWTPDGSGNQVYQMKSTDGKTAFKGGDFIWDDYNHDGVVDGTDKQLLGNAQPDWYAGWSNTINYKQFTLNFSFYMSWGGLIYNQLLYDLSKFGDNTSNADPRATIQGWRYQGQMTDWCAPGQPSQNGRSLAANERALNSKYLEDASFIRLQTVRLAYQMKSDLVKKMMLQSLQLYVYGGNLLTWTKYRGYDPEISTGGVLNPGADTQKYPRKREFGFGLNFSF